MSQDAQADKKFRLADGGRLIGKLPVFKGTLRFEVVDVRQLLEKSGYCTFDPSFSSTASCRSAITYIDGDKGILLHRGYPIDQLAEKSTYLEVAYLLLFGELPDPAELKQFVRDITYHTMVHEHLMRFYAGFP